MCYTGKGKVELKMQTFSGIMLLAGFILSVCCIVNALRGKGNSKFWYGSIACYICFGIFYGIYQKDGRDFGIGCTLVFVAYGVKIIWNLLKSIVKHEKYSAKKDLIALVVCLVLVVVGMNLPYDKELEAERAAASEEKEASEALAASIKAAEEAKSASAEQQAESESLSESQSEPEVESEPQPESEPIHVETEEEYKESCRTVGYKDLCRYPEKYAGTRIVIKAKVQQIMDASLFSSDKAWRVQDNEDGYDMYLGNEYYAVDKRESGSVKILQDDIVTIYGEFTGTAEITRALTMTKDEIPRVEVKYADLVDE